MRKMISNLGPPRSIHLEDEDPTKPVKWRSLRSRGAKLYAWATAARLSAEGRGAGVNLGFDPASPVQSMKKMEKEASETSLELMRIKATRKQQLGEKAKRERALALEATTFCTYPIIFKGKNRRAFAQRVSDHASGTFVSTIVLTLSFYLCISFCNNSAARSVFLHQF